MLGTCGIVSVGSWFCYKKSSCISWTVGVCIVLVTELTDLPMTATNYTVQGMQ